MILIWHLLFFLGVLFLFINVYLWFLAFASFLPEKREEGREDSGEYAATTRFVIVVPAHDESKVIARTIESLMAADYPPDRSSVVVVADNCTDDTARIAAAAGARCLERRDPGRIGKGYALDWAFGKLRGEDYDAAVIVDADTVAARDFLRCLDERVRRGEKAIQGYYDVIDPAGSPMTSLSFLGFVLNRNLRYKGRSRLGGSSNLLGNGMCFTREIIDAHGWPAKSVVEDLEFEIILNLEGTRVTFASEARIFAEIPNTFGESAVQRTRWDLGKFGIRNKYLPRLIRAGLSGFRLNCLDRALELFIPPYSILWALSLSLFLLVLVLSLFRGFDSLFFLWAAGLCASAAYVLLGLVVARAGWKVYRNLLYAPFFVLWRVKILLQGSLTRAADRWVKTER